MGLWRNRDQYPQWINLNNGPYVRVNSGLECQTGERGANNKHVKDS